MTEREKLYGNDASNKLSYTKMIEQVSKTHPRIKYVDENTKVVTLLKRPVCGTRIGSHNCCSRDSRRSDFDEYGVGTVLYFQFLKFMSC